MSLSSIGPGGQNAGDSLYPRTWTNLGPAVGFAYQLPWLGKGKTTIRGGYQLSYISMAGNFQSVEAAAGSSPGFFNIHIWNNNGTWAAGDYFGIKDLKANPLFANGVPVPSNVTPGLKAFPLYDRQQCRLVCQSEPAAGHGELSGACQCAQRIHEVVDCRRSTGQVHRG